MTWLSGRLWLGAVAAVLLTVPAQADTEGHDKTGHGGHWGYTGEAGPAHWETLSDAYEACGAGAAQSPVNIARAGHAEAAPPVMHYVPTPLRVVNNGHTVQVNYGAGATMEVDGKTYKLAQFHFHSPSEHQLDGTPYAMEAHLVHKADDGTLAVVGVLLSEGAANPFIDRIWPHLPAEVNHEVAVADTSVDVADLLPARSGFWHYAGSLTTPPCTEGVRWFVMDGTAEVSKAQVQRFLDLVHENARPVQPLNERVVEHRM